MSDSEIMPPVPERGDEPRILYAHEIVASLLRGIIGLAPGGSLLTEVAGLGVLMGGRLDRMRQAAIEMRNAVGDEDVLMNRIQEHEDLDVLVTDALEAAARTALENKRILLGRVAGRAVLDDSEIEDSQLIAAALRELDAPHIRALEGLRRTEDEIDGEARAQANEARDEESDTEKTEVAWSNRYHSVVGEAVRRAGDREPIPVRATLVRTGTVLPATVLGGGASIYRVSDFGRRLLGELADVHCEPPSE